MKGKKHITFIEWLILFFLLLYIVKDWNETKVTVGHFFSLELLAMLFWFRYDNFKK